MDVRHWFLRYSWVVNLVLLAGISYVWGKTVNGYIAGRVFTPTGEVEVQPVESTSAPAPPVEQIISRDLFAAGALSPAETSASDTVAGATAEVKETSLRLQLLATVFYEPGFEYNLATIQNQENNKTDVYIVGDTIGTEIVVHEIQIDHVLLLRGGQMEKLALERKEEKKFSGGGVGPQDRLSQLSEEERTRMLAGRRERHPEYNPNVDSLSKRIKQVGANEYVIEKSAIDEALADMNSIVTQARAIPNFSGTGADRKVDGFRIYRIQPGSIYEYLGLQNGDIIKSVNGEPMDSVEKALSLLQALRNETRFALVIQRHMNNMELRYEVD